MEQLTPLQTQAVSRLLAGQSVAAVARELDIDRSTLYAWRKHPHFSLILSQARARQAEIVTSALQDLAETAVDTIRDLMLSSDTPAAVRLRAAQAVLQNLPAPESAPSEHAEHGHYTAAFEELFQQNPTQFDTVLTENTEHTPYRRETPKIGRNELCSCGSGLKFKRCCQIPSRNTANTGTGVEVASEGFSGH
jgi:transposase-like protein